MINHNQSVQPAVVLEPPAISNVPGLVESLVPERGSLVPEAMTSLLENPLETLVE